MLLARQKSLMTRIQVVQDFEQNRINSIWFACNFKCNFCNQLKYSQSNNKLTAYRTSNVAAGTEPKDYCIADTFRAVCDHNEVIVMETARYGRMNVGSCVRTNFGFVGCSSDVLGLFDRRCSGRQRCTVRVLDPELQEHQPCNEEFKSYLQANFSCIQGTDTFLQSCLHTSNPIICQRQTPPKGQLPMHLLG